MKRHFIAGLVMGVTVLSAASCAVEKTREGKAPDVDVSVEEGRAPGYEVKGTDVDVKTKKQTVRVPEVDVKTEDRVVTVPEVDVDAPEETRRE